MFVLRARKVNKKTVMFFSLFFFIEVEKACFYQNTFLSRSLYHKCCFQYMQTCAHQNRNLGFLKHTRTRKDLQNLCHPKNARNIFCSFHSKSLNLKRFGMQNCPLSVTKTTFFFFFLFEDERNVFTLLIFCQETLKFTLTSKCS